MSKPINPGIAIVQALANGIPLTKTQKNQLKVVLSKEDYAKAIRNDDANKHRQKLLTATQDPEHAL